MNIDKQEKRNTIFNASSITLDHQPTIEVEIEGEDTKQFRIRKVDYELHKVSKQTRKPRFAPKSSLVQFSENQQIYDDASIDEIDIFEQGQFLDDEAEEEEPESSMESSFNYQKEQECYVSKLRTGSTPTCRVFGVYIKKKRNTLLLQVQQKNVLPPYLRELQHPSLSMQNDLDQLSKSKLEMSASFVPYFVLNNWMEQILAKDLPTTPARNNISLDITFQKKIKGALLVADVSHFTRLAQNFVRDDFRNVHHLNTRSIASEQLFKFLCQKIFNILVILVGKHGGDIVKFVGDSMFVIFPEENDDFHGDACFPEASHAVRAALAVSLEAFAEFDRKVHFGIGYGNITYNVVGNKRLEGFLSGNCLVDATDAERRSAKYSDDESFAPIVISDNAWSKLSNGDRILRRIFARVHFPSQDKHSELNKGRFYVIENDLSRITEVIRCIKTPKETTAYSEQLKNMGKILRNPRKCDILRSVLALTAPRVVTKYVNNTGVSLWASELRVCTSMFVLIGGDWNNVNAKQLKLLHEIVSKIQESCKEFGGAFLRFVIDDKGAQCFITFGLRPKKISNNGMRATLCAINIHEKIEFFRAHSLSKTRKSVLGRRKSKFARIANTLTRNSLKLLEPEPISSLIDNIHVAIGITTGKVICGNVGGKSRCEYTLHGECVNYANNLMGHAKGLELVEVPLYSIGKGKKRTTFKPRIAVGKEVYESTKSHIEYESNNLDVKSHCRQEERLKKNGKELSGSAYVVKGPRLPRFSLAVKEEKMFFAKKGKLVGRVYEMSNLRLEIERFAEGKTNKLWGVIRGETGMGKTVALGQFYNLIKEKYCDSTGVIPFFIQSTCIESQSKYFVFRALLMQIAQVFDLSQPHPTNLFEAYELVETCIKKKLPHRCDIYYRLLYAIFHPDGYGVKNEVFYNIGSIFTQLIKDLLTEEYRVIFLFDDWHLMNKDVADVLRKLVSNDDFAIGTIVTVDRLEESPFPDVAPRNLLPLTEKNFRDMGERWRKIPLNLLQYIRSMVNGNPQHAEELLRIITKAGWIESKSKRFGFALSLEAFSCIQDKKLEYRDFVIKEKHRDINDLLFSTGINKSTFLLEKLESTTKKSGGTSGSNNTYDLADHQINYRNIRDKITKPSGKHKKLNMKFTDYFDEDIYITEEKLTGYLDDTNTVQSMCVKVASVIGRKFRLKHLAVVLRNLSDDVLEIEGYSEGRNRGKIKAVHGDPELIVASLKVALSGLMKKQIFKKSTCNEEVENEAFAFVTPLLREITLNFMPQYLKQIIYRIITEQIEKQVFVEEDFDYPLDFHYFVSKFTDAANMVSALESCYHSIKQIEKHAYYNGEVQYYYESMSRLHAWHSFFIMNSKNSKKDSVASGSSKFEALNKHKETLSDNALGEFRIWYQTLDPLEVARSLRVGAEKVYWYATQRCADSSKERRHAHQIAQFGVQWMEPLVENMISRADESPETQQKLLAFQLELAQLYAIDFLCRRKRSHFEHPLLANICKDIQQRQHDLSILQEAEFSLPYILTFDMKDNQKFQGFMKKLLRLTERAMLSDLELCQKHFVIFKAVQSLNILMKFLFRKTRYMSAVIVKKILTYDEQLPKLILDWFEEGPVGVKSLSWRDEKVKYILNMNRITPEHSDLKKALRTLARNFFRREYGEYWADNEKLIVRDGHGLSSLYEFAKVV